MSSNCITIEIGKSSDLIGDCYWNIQKSLDNSINNDINKSYLNRVSNNKPRVVNINIPRDYSNNIDIEQDISDKNISWNGKIDVSYQSRQKNHKYTECRESKDYYHLPNAVEGPNFTTYLSGHPEYSEIITANMIEDILDLIRIRAEECDNLKCFNVFSDFNNGYSGLTTNLLRNIREDYGNAITIPVWGFCYQSSNLQDTISNNIQATNLPLLYSSITEYSDLICPIDVTSVNDFNSVYDIALSIEILTNHKKLNQLNSCKLSDRQWLDIVTNRSMFPIGSIEFSHHINKPLINSSTAYNPFCNPVSPFSHIAVDRLTVLNNAVFTRGLNESFDYRNIAIKVNENYFSSSELRYTIKSLSQDNNDIESIAALIADNRISYYIQSLESTWIELTSTKAGNITAQLEKLGYCQDDFNNISENLFNLSNKFTIN